MILYNLQDWIARIDTGRLIELKYRNKKLKELAEDIDEARPAVQLTKITVFETLSGYQNRYSKVIEHYIPETLVCLDRIGNRCTINREFVKSFSKGYGPVTVYKFKEHGCK